MSDGFSCFCVKKKEYPTIKVNPDILKIRLSRPLLWIERYGDGDDLTSIIILTKLICRRISHHSFLCWKQYKTYISYYWDQHKGIRVLVSGNKLCPDYRIRKPITINWQFLIKLDYFITISVRTYLLEYIERFIDLCEPDNVRK